jgi:hypothetical protein
MMSQIDIVLYISACVIDVINFFVEVQFFLSRNTRYKKKIEGLCIRCSFIFCDIAVTFKPFNNEKNSRVQNHF